MSVMIERGKVILNENGDVDTANEINRAYMMKAATRKKAKMEDDVEEDDFDDIEDVDGEQMSLTRSERALKHYMAVRAKKGAEIDELKIQKLNGMIVPTELVKHVIKNYSSNTGKAIKEVLEDMLNIWGSKYGISEADIKDMRKKGIDRINVANELAVSDTKKELARIVEVYSSTRGKGEKK